MRTLFVFDKSKRLPYFAEYLHRIGTQERQSFDGRFRRFFAITMIPAVGMLAAALMLKRPEILMGGLAYFGVAFPSCFWLSGRRSPPANSAQQLDEQARPARNQFANLLQGRKLHKALDPTAAQLLEAGAFHWLRIVSAFDAKPWNEPTLPSHYAALKDQVNLAAGSAMNELLLLCQTCIGEPQHSRKKDLSNIAEDFFELDWVDALQGLAQFSAKDWSDYAHHSPHIRTIFEPARNLCEKLKLLADQVEQASQGALKESVTLPTEGGTAQNIDLLLSEFQAIRQAEAELEQRHQDLRG